MALHTITLNMTDIRRRLAEGLAVANDALNGPAGIRRNVELACADVESDSADADNSGVHVTKSLTARSTAVSTAITALDAAVTKLKAVRDDLVAAG